MEHSDFSNASARLAQLKTAYQVEVIADWGSEKPDGSGLWKPGTWSLPELDRLQNAFNLVVSGMGGAAHFIRNLGGVTVRKADIGTHGGEALEHRVSLSTRGTFTTWTVVHELGHAWDAHQGWKLSKALERHTGGFTNWPLARLKRFFGKWDAGPQGEEDKPGRHGRLRGCNAAGYFYGDKPSGSNWAFDRKEDFAESLAMYLGWQKDNDLSAWAHARLERYLLANGVADRNFGVDNWADYAEYFYPENGDYTTTKRWKFIDQLLHGSV